MTGTVQALVREPSGRRTLPAVIAVLAGLLVLLPGTAITAIQLFYTIQYLKAIYAKTDVTAVAGMIPEISRPFMVDLALVAPALVAFTGGCIIFGALRILSSKEIVGSLDSFPFPRRYKTYFIQYGLLGTVIGFVIGFWRLDVKTDQAPVVMLAALSAALWSTLMAIALAYLFCPLIEAVFQKVLLPSTTRDSGEDALQHLDTRASQAAAALANLTATLTAADAGLTLRTISEELLSLRRDLADALQRLQLTEARGESLDSSLKSVTWKTDELRNDVNRLANEMNDTQQNAAVLRNHIEQSDKRIGEELTTLKARLTQLERVSDEDRQQRKAELTRLLKTAGPWLDRLRRHLEE